MNFRRFHVALATLVCGLVLCSSTVRAEDKSFDLWEQRHLLEVGLYAGIYLPPSDHELYELKVRFAPLKTVAFDGGLRVGYLPLPFLGVELEGGVMPTHTEDDNFALVYTVRAHLLGQYPIGRFAPFLLAGYGILSVASDEDAVGDDVDGAFHAGLGLKYYATTWLALRVDGRAIVSGRVGDGGYQPHFEVLAGASWVFGYKEKEEPPKDSDGDGVFDSDDKCPKLAGAKPTGCPPDSDGDGMFDSDDKCPKLAGAKPTGCPADSDNDGIYDKDDKCPKVAGVEPAGCPPDADNDGIPDSDDRCKDLAGVKPDGCPPDADDDGVYDKDDKCKDKPENKNGYQDEDGCPDVIPKKAKKFTGIIKGIYFDTGKATIRRRSHRTLNAAVKVLKQFADLNLLIRGHTDDVGEEADNLDLSKRRAASVRSYLVKKGVAGERLTTDGVGEAQPLIPKKTRRARAKNRRIEFVPVSKKAGK